MTVGDITFNARELIGKLRRVDVRFYENVLDTIADSFGRLGTWSVDEEGNLVLDVDDIETYDVDWDSIGQNCVSGDSGYFETDMYSAADEEIVEDMRRNCIGE